MSQAKWKPTENVLVCPGCSNKFGFFRHKHNCRACGEVYCKRCLPKEIRCVGYAMSEPCCAKCIAAVEEKSKSPVGMTANPAASAVSASGGGTAPTAESMSSAEADKIQALCQSVQPQLMGNAHQIAGIAKVLVDQAAQIAPPPFNSLCVITSKLLSLSSNCVANTAEAGRLGDRVSRVCFAILQLSRAPGNFQGSKIIADQLLGVFNDAISLLENFQPSTDRSFVDIVKAKMVVYSAGTVNKFNDIHADLTLIMQDRLFVSSVMNESAMAAPTLDQIQSGIQQEVAHVLNEVKKYESEGGTRLSHIEEQLQTALGLLSNGHSTGRDVALLDPRAVSIDTGKILGKGASGSVFAGMLYGSTEVAIKVLLNVPPTPEALAEVKHELEYTMRVSHRNVIKIYGLLAACIEFEGRAAVVMERLGQSLDSVIGKLPPPSYMKLTNDIIAGMARVHDSDDGVVHFDLKPANIMLTLDGRTAKVVDFGIAQSKTTVAFASASDTARARGTVAYMAPEILMGTSRGFYCDVYSFGVMMYSLWSGKKPWQGFGDAGIIAAVQQGSRPATDVDMIATSLPEPIVALIVSCWDQSPGNRPSFKNMMQLRDIDAFWETPSTRWPLFFRELPAVQMLTTGHMTSSSPTPVVSSSAPTSMSMPSSSSPAGTTTSSSKSGLIGVGGASVPSFNCEQLCQWLEEDQSIDSDVVAWLRTKKITGDLLMASGVKIIAKLRENPDIDEWNVDALERVYERIRKTIEQETERQQRLLEARKAAEQNVSSKREEEELAKEREAREKERIAQEEEETRKAAERAQRQAEEAIAAFKRDEDLKRAVAAAKLEEYARCQKLNLAVVEMWKEIWTKHDVALCARIFAQHYSPRWSGVHITCGKAAYNSDLQRASARSIEILKTQWTLLQDQFVVLEVTDTFVRFRYSTESVAHGKWTAKVRMDFEKPGLVLKSEFVIDPGLYTG